MKSRLDKVFGKKNRKNATSRKKRPHFLRPLVEQLEERLAPAATSLWEAVGPTVILSGQTENIDILGMNNPVHPENPLLPENPVVGAVQTVVAEPPDPARPDKPEVLYVGTVNGGIWKTEDAGQPVPHWAPLTDIQNSLSIGALDMDPTDATHRTLVAGLGTFSNFFSTGGPLTGLLRTKDGGKTWEELGSKAPVALLPLVAGGLVGANISGVASRGTTILVTANGGANGPGVYRSTDDGASFTLMSGARNLGVGPVSDLVGDPQNPQRFFVGILPSPANAGQGGIFRTDDAGATWQNVSGITAAAINRQVPGSTAATNNIEFAVHLNPATNSHVLYAGIVFNGRLGFFDTATQQFVDGVFRSVINDDPAQTVWSNMNAPQTTENGKPEGVNPEEGEEEEEGGGQGAVNFSIVADPTDPTLVYVGGDRQQGPVPQPNSIGATDFSGRLFRGKFDPANQTTQWVHLTNSNTLGAPGGGTSNNSSPHADSREMIFSRGSLIETDDGGIYRRTSPADNTGRWQSLNGDLQVSEVHDIAWDNISNVLMIGNQDTGSSEQIATESLTWNSITTADGGDVGVGFVSAGGSEQSIRYSSTQELSGFRWRAFDSSKSRVQISNASNTTPIRITLANHGLFTGDRVNISGVTGNTAANKDAFGGFWRVTRVDQNTFELQGSAGNGNFTGGGFVEAIPALTPINGSPAIKAQFVTPIAVNALDGNRLLFA